MSSLVPTKLKAPKARQSIASGNAAPALSAGSTCRRLVSGSRESHEQNVNEMK